MHSSISVALTRAIAIAALALLTGCVTSSGGGNAGPVADATTPSTPAASTTFVPQQPRPGSGVVHLGRPSGFNVSYFPVPIELDGQPLATVGPGRYLRVELSPGPHVIGARDDWWSGAINGKPHPVSLTVEPGKVYYLLPKRWAGEVRTQINVIGSTVYPSRVADPHSSFSVQTSAPGAAPPSEFLSLAQTDLERSRQP